MSKKIFVSGVPIGGGSDIAIQSMTNTKTSDAQSTLKQIKDLHLAGCDIVRCSVPDEDSAGALYQICKESPLPIVADIHFDAKLAKLSADAGVSKIRINPGNIGDGKTVSNLCDYLNGKNIPIRIGVNAGSLEADIQAEYEAKLKNFGKERKSDFLAEAMVASALRHLRLLENCEFYNTCISVKSSDVKACILANRMLANLCDYPLHIGVTEAGTVNSGIVKSAVGIGSLLADGIGDTIRVSLSGDPTAEVVAARQILRSVGLGKNYIEVISCPTCARTEIDVVELANKIEDYTKDINVNLTVAVMGCIVNGIGEGKHADLGVAGGRDKSILFLKGKQYKIVCNSDILEELEALILEVTNDDICGKF